MFADLFFFTPLFIMLGGIGLILVLSYVVCALIDHLKAKKGGTPDN